MSSLKNFSINKKNKSWLKFLIGVVVLIFSLWVLNIFVSPVKNFFYTVFYPVQKIFWSAGESSSSFFGNFFRGGALAKENNDLKNQNYQLLSQVAALQSITAGNQAQSDVSVACQNTGFNLVMAGVIGLDDNDILSINKGLADGISEGMPVISQQGVLFGKIIKAYKNFSQIMLVSNKNSIVNVKVQQNDITLPEVDGVVKGSGGLGAYLDLIPISSEINLEDVLVTSSVEKYFPKDILVGRIIQKEKNDQEPFQKAQISLFLNVKSAANLFVITNYKQTK